jgi:nitric oxide reductase NorD protein
MALDEYLFGKVANYFKEKKRAASAAESRTVRLESLRPRLTVIACAVAGEAIEIFPAEVEGGYKNDAFFLPAACSLFPTAEQNRQFYLFRTLYMAVQKRLHVNWSGVTGEQPTELSRQKAQETSPQVLRVLFEEFPVAHAWFDAFYADLQAQATPKQPAALYFLYGKWMVNTPPAPGKPLQHTDDKVQPAVANPHDPKTVLKAKIVEEIHQLTVDKKAQEDYVLTHNFEKVETAEEFNGVWRDFDGDDDLADHQDALDELNMKYTVRVDDPVHSVYQADFLENTTVSESADLEADGEPIFYDEWDFSKRTYKPRFCKLYPLALHKTDADYYRNTLANHASTLTGLRKMLTSVNNKMRQQRRQTQGDAFDTDSVTDLFVDLHTGHTPSEKIYLSNRKKERELSVLLLLDVSLSSDSYADGNRILDVEKQVSILFGEILHEFDIDFSIQCFYSKTRHNATYIALKNFDDPWQTAKMRVGAVDPGGYTRIGTALRHSGALLDRRPAKNKWLILLSDGKPNDFDRYEGKYGVEDVKQALRELHERQISTYALAIEATARYYLPQMFGQNNYRILSSPTELLTALAGLYERIRHQ